MSRFFVAEVTYEDDSTAIGLVRGIPHVAGCPIADENHLDYEIPKDSPINAGFAKKVVPLREIQVTDEDTVGSETTILDFILASRTGYA